MLSRQSIIRSGLSGMGGVLGGSSQAGIVFDGLISFVGSRPACDRISLEPRHPLRRALWISLTAALCLWMCCDRSMGSEQPLRVWMTVPRQVLFCALQIGQSGLG